MDATLLGIPLWILGLACLVPAGIFAAAAVPRGAHGVARWAHSVTWLLLAAACGVRVLAGPEGGGVAQVLGLAGLAAYLVFLRALRRRHSPR